MARWKVQSDYAGHDYEASVKVGDVVTYETNAMLAGETVMSGIIVAEFPIEGILNAGVSVLWASGELVERVPHRILKVISESR